MTISKQLIRKLKKNGCWRCKKNFGHFGFFRTLDRFICRISIASKANKTTNGKPHYYLFKRIHSLYLAIGHLQMCIHIIEKVELSLGITFQTAMHQNPVSQYR